MRWVLIGLVAFIALCLGAMAGMSLTVMAVEGIEGLEAYDMALQAVVASMQHTQEQMLSAMAQTQNTIIALFNAAIRE